MDTFIKADSSENLRYENKFEDYADDREYERHHRDQVKVKIQKIRKKSATTPSK